MSSGTLKITAEPGRQEILFEREVDAPPELVFRAFTEPELYAQWIGPRRLTTEIETFEPWSGGSYSYVQKDGEGNTYAFHGVYHEVSAPKRIIQTFEFEGMPETGHAVLEVVSFKSLPGGRTRLIGRSVFLTVEDRDGMLQSDMEEGMNDSYSRLDELLERMKVRT